MARGKPSSDAADLPDGWQQQIDNNGRVFYVDHIHRQTSWSRPRQGNSRGQWNPTIRGGGQQVIELPGPKAFSPSSTNSNYVAEERKEEASLDNPATRGPAGISVQLQSGDSRPLPFPWKKAMTPDGRAYYLNHQNEKTSWEHPLDLNRISGMGTRFQIPDVPKVFQTWIGPPGLHVEASSDHVGLEQPVAYDFFETLEKHTMGVVMELPSFHDFDCHLNSLRAALLVCVNADTNRVLHSLDYTRQVTLYMLWRMGRERKDGTGHVLGTEVVPLTGSKKEGAKSLEETIIFLSLCVNTTNEKAFAMALYRSLRYEGLSTKTDADLIDVLDTWKGGVVELFSRDMEQVRVLQKFLMHILLPEEVPGVDPFMWKECKTAFLKIDKNRNGSLSRTELLEAEEHKSPAISEAVNQILRNRILWESETAITFPVFVAECKKQGMSTSKLDSPEMGKSKHLSLQMLEQAKEIRKALIRSLGGINRFMHMVEEARDFVDEDMFNVYSLVSMGHTTGQHSRRVRMIQYMLATSVFLIQIILPSVLYLGVSEGRTKELCSSTGSQQGKAACFAVTIYYFMWSLPEAISKWSHLFSGSDREFSSGPHISLVGAASFSVLSGYATNSVGRRVFAAVDILQSLIYPHLVAALAFYVIFNATETTEIVFNFVALEFIHRLDEMFLKLYKFDTKRIKASIILNSRAFNSMAEAEVIGEMSCGERAGSTGTKWGIFLSSIMVLLMPCFYLVMIFYLPACY